MIPAPTPNAFALQFVPENTECSAESLAFLTVFNAPCRLVMNTIGEAPTDTVVDAGMASPVKGSVPLILNARTCAVAMLPGEAAQDVTAFEVGKRGPKAGANARSVSAISEAGKAVSAPTQG